MREEAEARARMKSQAEAQAKPVAAEPDAADDDDDMPTAEQHEQFFEKLFGSRRQSPRDEAQAEPAAGDARAETPRPETVRAGSSSAGDKPAPEEKATEAAAYAPDPDEAPGSATASPARNLFSYLVRRLTRQAAAPEKAPDCNIDALVTIEDLLNRVTPSITAPDGKLVTVPLPEDAMDGTTVRLDGYGHKLPGMKRGDVVATLRIKPHKWYRHDYYDLRTFHDIDIENAVLGCETTVETPDGPVRIRVPEWSGSNRVVKVEGKGLPRGGGRRGNLIVEIRVMLWDHPDQKVIDLMRSLREGLFL